MSQKDIMLAMVDIAAKVGKLEMRVGELENKIEAFSKHSYTVPNDEETIQQMKDLAEQLAKSTASTKEIFENFLTFDFDPSGSLKDAQPEKQDDIV